MNEEKVQEVIEFVYEEAHSALRLIGRSYDNWEDYEEALEDIRDKIEMLTDDDLGKD